MMDEDEWAALIERDGYAVVPEKARGPERRWQHISPQWRDLLEGKTIVIGHNDRMKFLPNFYRSAALRGKRLRSKTRTSGIVLWLEDR